MRSQWTVSHPAKNVRIEVMLWRIHTVTLRCHIQRGMRGLKQWTEHINYRVTFREGYVNWNLVYSEKDGVARYHASRGTWGLKQKWPAFWLQTYDHIPWGMCGLKHDQVDAANCKTGITSHEGCVDWNKTTAQNNYLRPHPMRNVRIEKNV